MQTVTWTVTVIANVTAIVIVYATATAIAIVDLVDYYLNYLNL